MTFASVRPPDPEPISVTWGARTSDHFYLLDIDVMPVALTGVPRWNLLEFAGRGPLADDECYLGSYDLLTQQGFRIIAGAMRAVDVDEFTAVALAQQAEANALLAALQPAPQPVPGIITPDEFDLVAAGARPNRAQRRQHQKRRR